MEAFFNKSFIIDYIESHPLLFWQKYVEGVNMTYFSHSFKETPDRIPINNNTFYLETTVEEKEYLLKERDVQNRRVAYFSSLIQSVLIEIGKLVNHSVHLFVFEEKDDIGGLDQIMLGNILGTDNAPMNYEFETKIRKYNCIRPLYMSDSLRIVSANVQAPLPPIIDIWKALKLDVWAFLLLFSTISIICHKMSYSKKSRNNKSIFHYLWIYAKPMLGVGEESTTARNIFYILWLFLLLPSIEIVKNELFSKMIYRNPINVDTIEDLLEDRFVPYTDHAKLGDWRRFAEAHLENNTFKETFVKFLAKTQKLDEFSSFADLFSKISDIVGQDPGVLRKSLEGSVLVQDESWMDFVLPILPKFISTHQAKYSYLPLYYTPLCYGPQFKANFIEKAELITRRLYETSIYQYMYGLKGKYYSSFALKFVRDISQRNLSDYYFGLFKSTLLEITEIQPLFEFVGYCFTFSVFVLFFEIFLKKF